MNNVLKIHGSSSIKVDECHALVLTGSCEGFERSGYDREGKEIAQFLYKNLPNATLSHAIFHLRKLGCP